jgi:hypothetical protein
MRLKNKKTGEICDFKIIADYDDCTSGWRLEKHDGTVLFYDHIDEIHSEWEDVPEEPKEYWFINSSGEINSICEEYEEEEDTNLCKEIGNYFETKEEAEKAVEKLKAFKRLKDKGFRFMGWTIDDGLRISICSNIDEEDIYDEDKREMKPDLDLLFGGEE